MSAPHVFGALVTTREMHTCRCGHVTTVFVNAGGETRCLLCVTPATKVVHVSAAEVADWLEEKKP